MARYHGSYLGICENNKDSSGRSRLQVKVPAVLGEMTSWARACVWPTGSVVMPSVGDRLWVMFEGGNADYPVWMRFEQRAAATVNYIGVYAGICMSTQDPAGKSRIQVKVPTVAGDKTAWAVSVPGPRSLPSVGDTVWIVFEEGDPQYPLWLGVEP
ncbi:MAG: hypothetical protein JNJ77_01300 [Planctomycetia bacterium]|nr:hypothetical protein [Planctomycetia bacterium]